ncbi:MAG: peptidoglycan-binding protein [Moorea sp. SIO2B7]|nr:peptidoglycan-binding protein [Moorena sp. SIO2B7]
MLFSGLEVSKDREKIYQEFLKAAAKESEDLPVLLYKGIDTSPYKQEIKNYPGRLMRKPEGQKLVSGTRADETFSAYPKVGQLPEINEQYLNFLHGDIKEACICLGSFVKGEIKVKWLGRNALSNGEFWSGTKIFPILNIVSQVNTKYPYVDLDNCNIKGTNNQGITSNFSFYDLAKDVFSYESRIGSSNSLGAMFKRFSYQPNLEQWLTKITGNQKLIFRGRYGENPFINNPNLVDSKTGKILLSAHSQEPQWGENTVSAYDLTRLISMLGWHIYIPQTSRLPGAQWKSLESVIRAMGNDPARLTDLAIAKLGLEDEIDSVVIISKLGNGVTGIRLRTEAVYVALVQLIMGSKSGEPAKLFTFSMALRGARKLEPRNLNQEAIELDARMATEVTEIIRRVVMQELV